MGYTPAYGLVDLVLGSRRLAPVRKECHVNQQERGCHSKRAYYEEIEALVVARMREGSGAPTLRAYRCQFCGMWHLTKRPSAGSADGTS